MSFMQGASIIAIIIGLVFRWTGHEIAGIYCILFAIIFLLSDRKPHHG